MSTILKGIWKWIVGASVFASILGVILMFCANTTAIIISLVFVCLVLTVILIAIIKTLNQYLKITNDEEYENYGTLRLMQCKRLMLSSIDYNFKWTGSEFPDMTKTIKQNLLSHLE